MALVLKQLKSWARALKLDIIALWLAARDSRTPRIAKIVAATVAGLALSPIDIIPDFIPLLGYLDDLLIIPLGIALAVRLMPPELMIEFRIRAQEVADRPKSLTATAIIVLLWLGLLGPFGFWLFQRFA